MNYLAEILAFNNWIRYNSEINKSDICLWYTLMYMANRFYWKEFNIPILTLLSESRLSRSDIYKSRAKLKKFGLIDFRERNGNKATIYKVNSIVSLYGTQNDTQVNLQSDMQGIGNITQSILQMNTQNIPQSVNIHKTRNNKQETRNKKEIYKEKFGEFGNVFLSADELQKLKSKFGAEAENYIEKLSSYIASSGKKYKSHYATILSWTQKDAKDSGGVCYGSNRKKLCTEYPE